MSKATTLHLYHAFLHISLPSLHNYDQILSLLGNGNGKAINSTISVRTWARSPLFSSSQNPRLLSNWTNWDKSRKSFKWCEVYFSATFSWTSSSDRGSLSVSESVSVSVYYSLAATHDRACWRLRDDVTVIYAEQVYS